MEQKTMRDHRRAPEWLVKRHENVCSRVYVDMAFMLDNLCGGEIPESVYEDLPERLQGLVPELLKDILEDLFKQDTHAVLDDVNEALQRVVARFPVQKN